MTSAASSTTLPCLAIDIGNTNFTAALWRGAAWSEMTRISTAQVVSAAAIGDWLSALLREWQVVAASLPVGIASVVPACDEPMAIALQTCGVVRSHFVTHADYRGPICYPQRAEIGADRLADAAAAYALCRRACLVLDFGTATTLDYIDNDGGYHGGPISPGLALAQDALSRAAAKLPAIRFADPGRILPRTTEDAMQAGLFYGGVDAIDGLIARIVRAVCTCDASSSELPLFATGGLAPLIVPHLQHHARVEPYLTLDGIRALATSALR